MSCMMTWKSSCGDTNHANAHKRPESDYMYDKAKGTSRSRGKSSFSATLHKNTLKP
jgi:hypothetical protein